MPKSDLQKRQLRNPPIRTDLNSEVIATNKLLASTIHWLGGQKIIGQKLESELDFIKVGEAGLTRLSIDQLTSILGIPRKKMAEEVLKISVKTIERKKPKEKFDARISSHLIEIAKLFQHAFEVFQDQEKVKQWLNTPNQSLKGLLPLQLLSTMTGMRMVDAILIRIEEGVYS